MNERRESLRAAIGAMADKVAVAAVDLDHDARERVVRGAVKQFAALYLEAGGGVDETNETLLALAQAIAKRLSDLDGGRAGRA